MGKLRKAFGKAVQRVQKEQLLYGRIGTPDGQVWVLDSDGNRIPRMLWVTLQAAQDSNPSVRAARNTNVQSRLNLDVVLWYNPSDGELEILEADPIMATAMMQNFGVNTPEHAYAHGVFGTDPLYLNSTLFSPLRCRPTDTPSLSVYVEPYSHVVALVNTWWPGGALDLTAAVPAGGGVQTPVVVALDQDTNTLTYVAGADQYIPMTGENFMPFDGSDLTAIDTSEAIRIAGIRLYPGQTTIRWQDFIADLRQFVYNGNRIVASSGADDSARFLSWRS